MTIGRRIDALVARMASTVSGDPKSWDAAMKVRLIEAMGFTPVGSDHQPDCPYAIDAGYRCNCVPPSTVWQPPQDVLVLRGETFEQRRDAPRRRIPQVERW